MYCPNCSCELPAIAKFCVRCGAPTGFLAVGSGTQPYVSTPAVPAPVGRPDRAGDHAYCGRCGAKVIEGNHFCSTCGNPLPAETAVVPFPFSIPEKAGTADSSSKHVSTASQATTSIGQESLQTATSIFTKKISESRGAKFPKIKLHLQTRKQKDPFF